VAERRLQRRSFMPSRDDLYQRYIVDLKQAEVLPRDEELELARRYRDTRDPEAAERLVRGHLRLVVKIAIELDRKRLHLLDLVQEGNLGLLHAVEKYDPERGAKLSVYAAWWMRAYMLRWLMANTRLVRIGTTAAQRTLFYNLGRAETAHGGSDDAAARIAEELGVSPEDVASMQVRLGSSELSIHVEGEGGGATLGDRLAAPDDVRPDARLGDAQVSAALRAAIERARAQLSPREREVLDARWMSDEQASLSDVGARFGVSGERARQIEKKALARVRAELRTVPELRAA
jgi:RNA polymerase sigma-32 factor